MRRKRESQSLNYFSRLTPGLALWTTFTLLFIFGHLTSATAQWLAPNLIYPLSASGYTLPLSSPTLLSSPSLNLGIPPSSILPAWPSGGLPGNPFASSALGVGPLSLIDPLANLRREAAYNPPAALTPEVAANPLAILTRAVASTTPPPERRMVGIESKQIQYRTATAQRMGQSYLPGAPSYIPNQVIVQFVPGTPLPEVNRVCVTHGCKAVYSSPYAGYTVLSIPPSVTVLQASLQLRTEFSVLFAEPNYIRRAHLIPNDPYYIYQWHLDRLNCSYAWDYGTGLGAVVALLDSGVAFETSGVYTQAPDLAGTLFAPGYDFVNNDAYPDDDYGHGTHMAGCIAQTTNNLLGVAGVAFNATIMPVKVMDNLGGVAITTEVDGIYYAANSGAKIISMSLGGPGTSVTEQAAITYAYNAGVTIVCSAGNAGSSALEYPASYTEPISVSAIRYDYTLPTYSNYGTAIDVCAPGGDLSVDQNLDGFGDGILQQTHNGTDLTTFYYYFMEGTSPACALVSGAVALIVGKSTLPLTPASVVAILEGSATDLGTVGWDQYYGYGLVNPYLAVLRTP